MRFCVKCGKDIEAGKFCKDCTIHTLDYKEISIKICCICSKYQLNNTWKENKNLADAVKHTLKIKLGLTDIKVIDKIKVINPGQTLEIGAKVSKDGNDFEVHCKLSGTYCNECKTHDKYFEGTLQVRKPTQEIIDYVDKYLKNNKLTVADRKEHKNGFDLYVTDNKKLQILAKNLKRRFGGDVKKSPHLHSRDRQKSKNIYRVSVLYQAPGFEVGNIVASGNEVYRIKKLGKDIIGENLETGKNVKIKKAHRLKIKETTVSKIKPLIEVIDPETFQSIKVSNKIEVKVDQKVNIVQTDKTFIV